MDSLRRERERKFRIESVLWKIEREAEDLRATISEWIVTLSGLIMHSVFAKVCWRVG
jgi:hypothetical protein